jgi:hypothetical protein
MGLTSMTRVMRRSQAKREPVYLVVVFTAKHDALDLHFVEAGHQSRVDNSLDRAPNARLEHFGHSRVA